MSGPSNAARRAIWLREGLVLVGFLLLVAAAVVTVVMPELRESSDASHAAGMSDAGTP